METKGGIVDSDFALFNDILDDIAIKTKEDEDDAFFGKDEKLPPLKLNSIDNETSKKVKIQKSIGFRGFSLASEGTKYPTGNIDNDFNNIQNDVNDEKQSEDYNETNHEGLNEGESNGEEDNDLNESNNQTSENKGLERQSSHASDSSVDDEIRNEGENVERYFSDSEDHLGNTEQTGVLEGKVDAESTSDESDSADENENNVTDDITGRDDVEGNDVEEKNDSIDRISSKQSFRDSDSISNIDLESVRTTDRRQDIKTVSFSMQYDKFCNVLNQLETGMSGRSVCFDVDAVSAENKLMLSPTNEFLPKLFEEEQQPQPLKKKKKVKKKHKKSASKSKTKDGEENKCFCRTCKYSIYNQPRCPPSSDMFKSSSQPPVAAVKKKRPKTAVVKASPSMRQESKMIDLEFHCNHGASKLDADLKSSRNPVLIAWLKVKKEEEKEKKRQHKRDIRKKEDEEKKKLLKIRQRSYAATERVQEWINRKRSQVVEPTRKQLTPPSLPSPNEPDNYSYSEDKFESGLSSEDEKETASILPQIVPAKNRPKTSRGPKKRTEGSLASSSTSDELRDVRFKTNSQMATLTQTTDSGFNQDEYEDELEDFKSNRTYEHPHVNRTYEHPHANYSQTYDSTFNRVSYERQPSENITEKGSDNEPDMKPEETNMTYAEPEETSVPYDQPEVSEENKRDDEKNILRYTEEEEEDEKEDYDVTSEEESDSDQVSAQTESVLKFVLSILNTQIKFDSVREFTDLIVNESVEEMELNARLKQKRLRRPMTSVYPSRGATSEVDAPKSTNFKTIECLDNKQVDNINQSDTPILQSDTSLASHISDSPKSVTALINFEKSLLGNDKMRNQPQPPSDTRPEMLSKYQPKPPSDHQPETPTNNDPILPSNFTPETPTNIDPQPPSENYPGPPSMTREGPAIAFNSREEWIRNKQNENKMRNEKDKAMTRFYNDLETKIILEEKMRRIAEKEASKKRVDSGAHKKVRPYTSMPRNQFSGQSKLVEKHVTGTHARLDTTLDNIVQKENLYKFGRNQTIKN